MASLNSTYVNFKNEQKHIWLGDFVNQKPDCVFYYQTLSKISGSGSSPLGSGSAPPESVTLMKTIGRSLFTYMLYQSLTFGPQDTNNVELLKNIVDIYSCLE